MAADAKPFIEVLCRGGVLACPTETQIGLLADALNARAVQRVCELKRRPEGEAISVIVPSLEAALRIAEDPSGRGRELAARYWPGPLTLVMRARPGLPAALLKGGTIALRVPGPSPAFELVTAFGGPLTATSANLSGQPPLERAAELRAVFGDALDGVVPGASPGAPPSTIVDVTAARPVVLRQGAIVVPA